MGDIEIEKLHVHCHLLIIFYSTTTGPLYKTKLVANNPLGMGFELLMKRSNLNQIFLDSLRFHFTKVKTERV